LNREEEEESYRILVESQRKELLGRHRWVNNINMELR
jgi:hypothetical protein